MWKNILKTTVLMTALAGIMMFIGSLIGGTSGMTFAFVMAMMMNGIMYFFSDRIVLKIYGAQPLDPQRYPHIVEMVEELCRVMRIPMPKLWIIKTPVANAFATGRNPAHGSIALTTGILDLLEPHELRGVIAHELSHILNRDILITTIAATFATAIGYMANMIQHMLFFNSSKDRNNKSPAGMIITALFMPIIATLIRLSISRSREYLADEQGAHSCHDPLALASALQKLHSSSQEVSFSATNTAHQATSGLFIVNPFNSQSILELFSTHPPLKKRISALHKIHHNLHE